MLTINRLSKCIKKNDSQSAIDYDLAVDVINKALENPQQSLCIYVDHDEFEYPLDDCGVVVIGNANTKKFRNALMKGKSSTEISVHFSSRVKILDGERVHLTEDEFKRSLSIETIAREKPLYLEFMAGGGYVFDADYVSDEEVASYYYSLPCNNYEVRREVTINDIFIMDLGAVNSDNCASEAGDGVETKEQYLTHLREQNPELYLSCCYNDKIWEGRNEHEVRKLKNKQLDREFPKFMKDHGVSEEEVSVNAQKRIRMLARSPLKLQGNEGKGQNQQAG